MSAEERKITRDDIIPMEEYGKQRAERRTAMSALKRKRRIEVGPFATFYFESYETMWQQIHEMLYIEKGGEEQIADELAAYNPLIPQGRELVATLMFEIDDPVRRHNVLARLGGVEETITLSVGGETIQAKAEEDIDRTTAEGKASSVQFVHFPFTDEQVAKFRDPATQVLVGITHPAYGHMAVMPSEVQATLAGDFAD
tara:strand:- start:978 stop:1574 length:597 start_codon:yes stop_codon:yes gene_type:complete